MELPVLDVEMLGLSPDRSRRKRVLEIPDFSTRLRQSEIDNIAHWMIRTRGSFNHQLGDQAIMLLLDSGELPENTVVAVTTPGQMTHYLRSEGNPTTLQEVMPHEYKIELQRVAGYENAFSGSAPQAHYNLLHNGVLVANLPDGDCLYRAFVQRLLLGTAQRDLQQIKQRLAAREDLDREIQQLRHHAANTFINSPDRYLERLDRQILARDYAQIASRRAGIDTPASMSQASSLAEMNSLASTVSQISLAESEPTLPAINIEIKDKLKRGLSVLLPDILAQIREINQDETKALLNKIRVSRIIGLAAFGIMSGEAETAGTLVLLEVTQILQILLEHNPELASQVFAALMPEEQEEQVQFINTLPLIMGHPAALNVFQLFNSFSHDSRKKEILLEAMKKKHIADRPSPLVYISSKNFFERMHIASKRIGLMLYNPALIEPQNSVINTLMEKTDLVFRLSVLQLETSGLVAKSSLLRRASAALTGRNKVRNNPQAARLPTPITTEKPLITDDILRQALQADTKSLERRENQRDSLRNIHYQVRQQMDSKSSESLHASVALGGLIAGGVFAQNEKLRQRSLAEREGRNVANDAEKELSRAQRDYNSDVLRHQSLDPIRLGVSLSMDIMAEALQEDHEVQNAFVSQRASASQKTMEPRIIAEQRVSIDPPSVDSLFARQRHDAVLQRNFQQQVDDLMEEYINEFDIDLRVALPDVPMHEFDIDLSVALPDVPSHEPQQEVIRERWSRS